MALEEVAEPSDDEHKDMMLVKTFLGTVSLWLAVLTTLP